jgi:dihydroxyacetone kinase
MKMKKFLNDPNTLTDELLQGYALAASDLIDVEGHLVISKTLKDADRVTIVTLGGSGHEPAQAGFVGDGMIDIQVVGDVFAAPSPQSVFEAVKMADKGHGVLLLVLNHAGDMLCANMVMKMAERAAITVRKVITQEDISNAPRENAADRRGLAGAIPLYHIAAAAAKEGKTLDEVADIAQKYADAMATISVAVRCATHPANGESFGDLGDDDMEIGMGQHGEGGGGRQPMKSSQETIAIMANALVKDIPLQKGDKCFVMINGSGATTLMEMFILYKDCVEYLENLGIDTLKPQLEAMISGYDGEWSVYVKDLESNEDFALNDKPLYSASLIKAFVMAKTYQDMDDVLKNEAAQMKTTVDNTKVQDKVNTLLWNMITVSDNESCNELGRLQSDTYDFIDGAKQVNKYLKKEGYTKTSYQSTLHPSASKLITLGGHNQTTVTDCGKLLERIYRGECVSKEASEEMLDLLKNQQNTSKIPEGLGVDVPTANKTGETDEDQHDIAIVYGTKTTYILCVMSENASNAIANIRNISRVVYNYLNL